MVYLQVFWQCTTTVDFPGVPTAYPLSVSDVGKPVTLTWSLGCADIKFVHSPEVRGLLALHPAPAAMQRVATKIWQI